MSDYASRQDVEEAAADWTAAVLQCRLHNRHNWEPMMVTHDRYGYTVSERCSRTISNRVSRCGCTRTFDMDARGYISKPHISYPQEGYLLKGLGRVDADGRAALRLVWVTGMNVTEVAEE
jgi:hypothetical protein